jgi:hypothetical protein
MDETNSRFGNLSLRATEWKPSSVSSNFNESNSNDMNSDLNPGTLKEFVPGQGWTASTSNVATTETDETNGGLFYDSNVCVFDKTQSNESD